MMNLATLWSFFEVIHARTYSHIIKQTFDDPNEMLEELYADAEVLQRSDVIVEAFDNVANLERMSALDKEKLFESLAIFKSITVRFPSGITLPKSIKGLLDI